MLTVLVGAVCLLGDLFPFVMDAVPAEGVADVSALLPAPAGKDGFVRRAGAHFETDAGRILTVDRAPTARPEVWTLAVLAMERPFELRLGGDVTAVVSESADAVLETRHLPHSDRHEQADE